MMKKHYMVGVREVHFSYYTVMAENEEEAKQLVNDRAPEITDMELLEYSHKLGIDTWSVEESPGKDIEPSGVSR